MRLRISARNLELPASMKSYVAREVEALTRYFDQILEADVKIVHEKHLHRVDVRLHVNGASYQAEATGDNLKVPVDEVMTKLRRQLKRHKSRLRRQSLRRDELALRGEALETSGAGPEMPDLPATGEVPRRQARTRPPRPRR